MNTNWLQNFDEEEIHSFLIELLHLIDRKDFKTYNAKCEALTDQVIYWQKSATLLEGMNMQDKYDRVHGSSNE